MVAIPLLAGMGAKGAEWIDRYPLNLEPIPVDSGIAKGQFRFAAGATPYTTGPGIDRGAIYWNGVHYRVMGTKLVRVNPDATVDTLGDVSGTGPVSLDYSYDRLIIRSGTSLYYWNGTTLAQVTDVDLGQVLDAIWIRGFTMTTDGTSVVVTELSDPMSVQPQKYGSAESDPDPVTGLLKNRITDEAIVLGRYTVQTLTDVGGNGFPFATVPGSTLPVGCVSASAKAYFGTGFAFVGSGRNEALGVHMVAGQSAQKISTRTVEDALAALDDPTAIEVESRAYRDEQRLYVHLPTETWVYLLTASARTGEAIWYRCGSGVGNPYRLRHAVLCGQTWYVGDTQTAAIGKLAEDTDTHFGEAAEWQFRPGMIYNGGKPGIVHQLELVGLPGRNPAAGSFGMSMTEDGEIYGQEKSIIVRPGDRGKKLVWRPHRRFQSYLGLKFRGVGGRPGFSALEAAVQPL